MGKISYEEYSNRDMKYAKDMLALGNYDPCGRFCQQTVEKRMKHYLEHKGTVEDLRLFSVHKLVPLYTRICELSGTEADKAIRGELHELTSYYFDTNYPNDTNVELTKEMAEEAVCIAQKLNTWIDAIIS